MAQIPIQRNISLCPFCKKGRSLYRQRYYTTSYGTRKPPKWRVFCTWCGRYWQFDVDPRLTGSTNPPPPSQLETRSY
jgi:hypothetical protein